MGCAAEPEIWSFQWLWEDKEESGLSYKTEFVRVDTMAPLHLPCCWIQPKSVKAFLGGPFFNAQKARYKSGLLFTTRGCCVSVCERRIPAPVRRSAKGRNCFLA